MENLIPKLFDNIQIGLLIHKRIYIYMFILEHKIFKFLIRKYSIR